jgi:CubicO group peptidase (beta-lactamase class C family)
MTKLSKTQFRLIFVALLFVSSSVIAQTQTTLSEKRLDRYDSYLQSEIDQGRIAGAVTLIYKNGEKVHEKALGLSDLDTKAEMKTDQIFYIQSMTKPIITAAFMMLYEEGYFLLSDPISNYLPEFKEMKVAKDVKLGTAGGLIPAASQITIAQVLSHTAGFSHGLGSSKVDEEVREGIYMSPQADIASRVKTLAGLPLLFQPGARWSYSASPDILARLIEVFSGMSSAEFLQERIFDPLEMKDTGYNLTTVQQARMTQLHGYDEQGKLVKSPRQTPMEGNTVFGGTHGLFSTPKDYSIFARMLLQGGEWNGQQLLSPKTIEIMTMDQIDGLYKAPGQGFGFGFGVLTNLANADALGSVGQYYWSGAYCTYFFIDPKEELISIMMTQTAPFSGFYEQKMRQMVYQAIQ